MPSHGNAQLSFTIIGKSSNVEAGTFAGSFDDAITILHEIDIQLSQADGGSVVWEIVGASTNSPLSITLEAKPIASADYGGEVVEALFAGLESLEIGGRPPLTFTPLTLDRLQHLNSHLKNGVGSYTFATKAKRFSPTKRFIENVATAVAMPEAPLAPPRATYFEIGTIEGRVETLVGPQKYFSLYDVLTKERIRCDFPDELLEEVRTAWQKRAIVEGRIQFSPDGKPQSMRVDSISLKSSVGTLPQFKDFGIDITGGIAPGDYVRGLRDD